MNNRNLAYIALLAGWLCFCFWLYVYGIVPRFESVREKSWPNYKEDLNYPLAYTWASDIPMTGPGFGALKNGVERIDSTNEVLLVRGYYFRDEMEDTDALEQLAHARIEHMLDYLDFDKTRVLKVVDVQAITGDVKANPFEAIRFERIPLSGLMSIGKDTAELCFPLKDSIVLPALMTDALADWLGKPGKNKSANIHLTGTADGSGIAESSDTALERALWIKEKLLLKGWKENQINISSGQRNHRLTLKNRCVIVYFE